MVIITKHAMDRRKRLGLSKKSFERMANIAFDKGFSRESFSGQLRRYIDKYYYQNNASLKIYGNFLFIFKKKVLITVWDLPSKFNKN